MDTANTLTLSHLPDRVLLARTRQLVDRERHLHVDLIDHLREIEDRDLHLARGFSTLFDYTVNELGYSTGAAWRRTLTMRLCRRMADVRERLRNGSLTLSTAAQLQSAFERQERKRRRAWVQQQKRNSHQTAAPATAAVEARHKQSTGRLPSGTAAFAPDAATAVRAETPVVVLDTTGQRELVKQATGKTSRQVEELLASVDPNLAAPREQLRARGDGTWTFTVVLDRECRRGLDHLKALLSHVDPAMSYGQLVNRLVNEELRRRDPRKPASNRDDARPPATGGSTAKRTTPEPAGRAVPAAIKRAVWERDEGRCSYVDPATGRRCTSCHLLQIDHIRPWAKGGGADPANLRLLCHAHHRHRHAGPPVPRAGSI